MSAYNKEPLLTNFAHFLDTGCISAEERKLLGLQKEKPRKKQGSKVNCQYTLQNSSNTGRGRVLPLYVRFTRRRISSPWNQAPKQRTREFLYQILSREGPHLWELLFGHIYYALSNDFSICQPRFGGCKRTAGIHKELIKHYRKYSPANARYTSFVRC